MLATVAQVGDTLADRITALLAVREWSGYRLAKETGLSPTYIQKLIGGMTKRPSYETVERLAKALDVSSDYLRTGQELPELPGTDDLPAPFRRVIQRIGQQLDARDWEIAAAFLEGLAARRGVRTTTEDAPAYGYQVPEQPAADQQGEAEKTA